MPEGNAFGNTYALIRPFRIRVNDINERSSILFLGCPFTCASNGLFRITTYVDLLIIRSDTIVDSSPFVMQSPLEDRPWLSARIAGSLSV